MIDTSKNILSLIEEIESELEKFYQFSLSYSAKDFILSKCDLKRICGDAITKNSEWNAAGSVWYLPTQNKEEAFIALHISDIVCEELNNLDPLKALTSENLSSFWILAEEISHFHLIINRGNKNRSVSMAELEWQGEVDKFLLSAAFLQKQYGDPHMAPLLQKLIFETKIVSQNIELYNYATKMTRQLLEKNHRENPRLEKDIYSIAEFIRQFYLCSHSEKHSLLSA